MDFLEWLASRDENLVIVLGVVATVLVIAAVALLVWVSPGAAVLGVVCGLLFWVHKRWVEFKMEQKDADKEGD